jgi:monofunctional biosynthetic peptidoglycan transglycosylase
MRPTLKRPAALELWRYALLITSLCLIPIGPAATTPDRSESVPMLLISFEDPEEIDRWRIINDGVMGGISRSSIERTDSGNGVFAGVVSLENNGGFASCRRRSASFNLDDYSGILLRVKGDGQTYKFRVRMDDEFVGVAYSWDFETVDDKWLDIRLPFDRSTPTMFGQPVPNAPSLQPEEIRQIGFLISDKQAGPFELEIDHVSAYQ